MDANAQLVQANSWPFLQIDGHYSSHGPTHIMVTNAGIGPAKLVNLQVLYKGQPAKDVFTLLEQCCGLASTPEGRHAQAPDGLVVATVSDEVLRPGETRPLIELPGTPAQHELSERFLAASTSASISFRACYCSVFDQCWISRLAGLRPTPIAACPDGITSFNDGTT